MRTLLAAILAFVIASGASVYATGEKGSDSSPFTIMEANAVSVSVSVGKAGDVDAEKTFKITDSTTVRIDNQPASAGI